MFEHIDVSRRRFLRRASVAGGVACLPALWRLGAPQNADAAVPADYRALICIYFSGGCDALNFVAPYDVASHTRYAGYRGAVALARQSLLPLQLANANAFAGRQVGLHPRLTYLAQLYAQGDMAVLGQVGPTPAPLRKTNGAAQTVNGAALPPGIASHVDQYREWLQQKRDGVYWGWGGLMSDTYRSGNGQPQLTNISTASYSPLLGGRVTSQFTVGHDGTPLSEYLSDYNDSNGTTVAIAGGSANRANLLEREIAVTFERLRGGAEALSAATPSTSLFAVQPPGRNELAQQLAIVLRIASGASSTGMKRQVFYCTHGGFDTHSNQLARNDADFTSLNAALNWFVPEAQRLGLFDKTLLFTTSEFGRSLVANGDGTDHGWAGHHLIIGAQVKGGDVYGAIPELDRAGDDFTSTGEMIPKVSVDQYGAALARWMGLSDAQLTAAFPNIRNFQSQTLGFI
ncbi:MAG: DUF1501 domain-containing protein [Hyphomonadaceae bacterium]|nr:DUF1501 domain-containing protein [Hyphomonadaceae bacterium]